MAAEGYAYYKANTPQEVKDAVIAQMAAMQNDEAARTAMHAKVTEAFTAADANSDGRLDLGEFNNFVAALENIGRENGTYFEQAPGLRERYYHIYNEITGGEDGITMAQYFAGTIMIRNEHKALADADGQ